ncbi:hypothetical protein, variant 2 [Capsaspora owczarzaki ATCC 30864]|uniref:HPt domain-containing protein n=1 Tax=Capsaspora owczarzaki (strain ATCC 30864) TaxID=595528 RepID=A0A0D2WN23_CAPO3|nr:hypothetical protein, variant 2 [Capsaspora owczarzaki ATCC 30864]
MEYQEQQPPPPQYVSEVNLAALLPEAVVDLPTFLKLRMDPSDNTFLLETSYELLSKAPERLSLFRQGLATGDYIALKHLAHREKGSASTLGFNRLANAMLRFEYASYLVVRRTHGGIEVYLIDPMLFICHVNWCGGGYNNERRG